MVHLPSSTYATIWYALLCLSKLSLLFHADEHGSIGLDKRAIHSRGVAIIQRFGKLSVGNDVWSSSKKVVGNMLAWIDKTEAGQQDPVPPSTRAAQNIHDSQVSDQHSRPENARLEPQPMQPPSNPPEQATSIDMQFQPTYELDAAMWQHMIDNFTWFEPVLDNGFSRQNLGA